MSRTDTRYRRGELDLRRALRRHLSPLAILLVVVVATGAPVSAFVLGLQELRSRGAHAAADLAGDLSREAARRPRLWQYDSLKVLDHVRSYDTQPDVARILVLGARGLSVDAFRPSQSAETPLPGLVVWEGAPVSVGEERMGHVWVAMSQAPALRSALWLFIPCLVLGALLAALILSISGRYARRAEDRIRGLVERLDRSRQQLSAWNENLERDVEARLEELRTLSARAVSLQESERRAIGRDLHDSVGQALTAVRIQLQLLQERAGNAEAVRQLAQSTRALTDSALDEVRRATARLGPAVLDEIGLAAALERLTGDLSERAALVVNLRVTGESVHLPEAVEVACYRIAQEALTNVVRHADATAVDLVLTVDRRRVRLEIRDDGAGCDPHRTHEAGAGGIDSMRERAELAGGRLEISSAEGRGTRVLSTIPLAPISKLARDLAMTERP